MIKGNKRNGNCKRYWQHQSVAESIFSTGGKGGQHEVEEKEIYETYSRGGGGAV